MLYKEHSTAQTSQLAISALKLYERNNPIFPVHPRTLERKEYLLKTNFLIQETIGRIQSCTNAMQLSSLPPQVADPLKICSGRLRDPFWSKGNAESPGGTATAGRNH